jgi:glycosyltransferase involved in cell wall biosynthesis
MIRNFERIDFVPLKKSWGLVDFAKNYYHSRNKIRELISAHTYLCFSIGGLIGDWGAIASLQASIMGHPYAVWADRVEHKVILSLHHDRTGIRRFLRKIRSRVESPLMAALEKRVISHATLGLFHGADCFDAYSSFQKNSFLVHNIHLKVTDQILPDKIDHKCSALLSGDILRLVYVGRVAAMKGPNDWVNTMIKLRDLGLVFHASWLGDGPLIGEMKKRVQHEGLQDIVEFRGHISDRQEVINTITNAHLFVFCHKTPESPRSLIEALISATPFIGYKSAYPENLLSDDSLCSTLLSKNNEISLANKIFEIASNRELLSALVRRAAEKGRYYSDEAVFKHRSNLIKGYL